MNIYFGQYRILFALAKLTKSNNEYYSCCEIYSNSTRYSNIQIFSNNLQCKDEGFSEISKNVVFCVKSVFSPLKIKNKLRKFFKKC